MLFNSDIFLFVFLPITFVGFLVLRKSNHTTPLILWLIAASLFFYSWWNPKYLLLILSSITVNYVIGRWLNTFIKYPTAYRRAVLIIGIAFNLSLIAYYKYAGFFISNLNAITRFDIQIETIVLPLAISFFTFQQISYLVDSYKLETRRYPFLPYCLYVTFFPQLIAGPIVYHKEALPQFLGNALKSNAFENFAIGISIFIIGLAKKILIADNLALYATPVFDSAQNGQTISFFNAWTGTLAYTFQLYFDFSGYSDMAIGLARLFGIKLPFNFNSPYKALSIVDFWRRWHMTLSRFLRDYLYIPLGGNRHGPARRLINIMITMLLGGLWHGASWTFVIWGGLHGLYITINVLWRRFAMTTALGNYESLLFYKSLAAVITFMAVVISWVFFRAESFDAAISIILGLIGQNHLGTPDLIGFSMIACAALIAFMAPNSQTWMNLQQPLSDAAPAQPVSMHFIKPWQAVRSYAVIFASLGFASIYMLRNTSEFLYFQF